MQLQGIEWANLPKNVPTITDVPWGIGGNYRYDFGNATHTCVVLSKECARPDVTSRTEFSDCALRCWGWNTQGNMVELPSTVFSLRWTTLTADASDLSSGNPQGRVFHLAGSGAPGDSVGNGLTAQFKYPQAMALTRDGSVLIADTGNHRICRVTPGARLEDRGTVAVIAGTGVQGDQDGPALTEAKFAKPGGITLYYDDTDVMVVIIADTNNHRIRKLYNGQVTTLSGRRGMGPQQGFRDGSPLVTRFNFPRRVLADPEDGVVYVSDSYNHLIRRIQPDGMTDTLSGNTERVTNDEAGCPPPCLKGVDGYRDGNLTYARFHQPNGMAWGMNGTLLVLDGHRLRRIEFRGTNTIQGITSRNRVSTISGGAISGKADGMAEHATFNEPKGVTMAADGRIYVADFVGSRVRRLTRAYDIPKDATCETTADSLVRPSGCSSYDVLTDSLLAKGTPIAGNIYYNKGVYLTSNDVLSPDMYSQLDSVRDRKLGAGLRVRSCLGFPPPIESFTSSGKTLGPQSGTSVKKFSLDEDAGVFTEIVIRCPPGCTHSANTLYGDIEYTDFSRVCVAAIHSGVITSAQGGFVTLRFIEGKTTYAAQTRHGITSEAYGNFPRSFLVKEWHENQIQTETIAGRPGGFLEENRGPRIAADRTKHTQPPMAAYFDRPSDIAVDPSKSLTNETTLFVLDQYNHRIMRITAVCSQTCENGGTCVSPETCECAQGWKGQDCTIPLCGLKCPSRSMCVAPDVCACIPGFTNEDATQLMLRDISLPGGPYTNHRRTDEGRTLVNTQVMSSGVTTCNIPLCVQTCINGKCGLPDTCFCDEGWFGTNCTVPVCSQTCGNGGNCTRPNTCACPSNVSVHVSGVFWRILSSLLWRILLPTFRFFGFCSRRSSYHTPPPPPPPGPPPTTVARKRLPHACLRTDVHQRWNLHCTKYMHMPARMVGLQLQLACLRARSLSRARSLCPRFRCR